jgi:hypothetical protein
VIFLTLEVVGIVALSRRQSMRWKSEKSPGNSDFSPSPRRNHLYAGADEIERVAPRDFPTNASKFS